MLRIFEFGVLLYAHSIPTTANRKIEKLHVLLYELKINLGKRASTVHQNQYQAAQHALSACCLQFTLENWHRT